MKTEGLFPWSKEPITCFYSQTDSQFMSLHPSPSISTLILSSYLRLGLSHCITQWLDFVSQTTAVSFEFGLMLQKFPNSVRTKCLRFRFELSLSHLSSELSHVRFCLVNGVSPVVRGMLVSHLNTSNSPWLLFYVYQQLTLPWLSHLSPLWNVTFRKFHRM
jgi:hypothetical protein